MRSNRPPFRRYATIGAMICAVGIAALLWWNSGDDVPLDSEARLLQAQRFLEQGELEQARTIVEGLLDQTPRDTAALFLAGTIAERGQRPEDAVERFLQVVEQEDHLSVEAGCRAAQIQRQTLRQLSDAAATLNRVRRLDPEHLKANRLYSELLLMTGRRWESRDVDLALIQTGEFTYMDLVWFSLPCSAVYAAPDLPDCLAATPVDPLAMLGSARLLIQDDRIAEAESELRQVLQAQPDLLEAHAQLGRTLADQERWLELLDWQEQLPDGADGHPEVWTVRGRAFLAAGDLESATRSFLEALRLDCDHLEALSLAATTLYDLDYDDVATRLADRAHDLDSLRRILTMIVDQPDDISAMQEAARLCQRLGRLWEALGWSEVARRRNPSLDWAVDAFNRLGSQLTPETPRTPASANPACDLEPELFTLRKRWEPPETAVPESAGPSSIRFVDDADAVGIRFAYANGKDPEHPGLRMFELNGGGVAVPDYDRDGWPDVYFTQGGVAPPDVARQRERDHLYRNEGGRFRETANQARLLEDGFSQGVTMGDYDSDGFPDLYVANIGRNRLFRNQGDGTFLDVTDSLPVPSDEWTSSCLLADLNGDALPDMYDVNYLTGDDLFERTCVHEDGVRRACMPKVFDYAADQIRLNGGDGSFRLWSDAVGDGAPGLPGLGIVAARLGEAPALELFIANDGQRNCHLTPVVSGGRLSFREQAVMTGLAFDGLGRSLACMGVACGDANGDGRLDLFVTNFYHEPNCLYLAHVGGMFRDATHQAGLLASSMEMLAFGTQFLDADLDGWLDLVVANGSLVDRTSLNEPYRMRPQFYWNAGQARFQESEPSRLGKFFETERLGRALARLDWNRDGRDDFAVSHLDGHASLVTNRTHVENHSVTIHLCGTQSAREAIGANVTIETDDGRRLVRQLTAGDGYQCTNQRALVIGLGAAESARSIEVVWPSGLKQSWQDVEADREWLLIEDRSTAVELPVQPTPPSAAFRRPTVIPSPDTASPPQSSSSAASPASPT